MEAILAQLQQMDAEAQEERRMMMAMIQQLTQVITGMVQGQQSLMQVMAAPKLIMKDEQGNIAGVRTGV